ncbi:hypothetical protein O9H85_08280 [Paenibacillus filicis]|uniref:Uncharacterized protein n=1 Tax=Paenibacillus gyeongsangnamensis TaxID=3388067 RepID=A0ABT4Q6D2_9BACL|nr:hypothetical protein [Paenibacillus filicis]MCZ8512430.1 hypothetical protein [Paenibacillus filicis]
MITVIGWLLEQYGENVIIVDAALLVVSLVIKDIYLYDEEKEKEE